MDVRKDIDALRLRLDALYERTHRVAPVMTQEAIIAAHAESKKILDDLATKAPLLRFQVGDGHAWYVEIEREDGWSYLYWVWGGADNWILPVGALVVIPVEETDRLLASQKAMRELFAPEERPTH